MEELPAVLPRRAQRIQRAAEVINARSDEEAVAKARALAKPTACEIWQGRRLVATLPAAKPE